MTKLEKQIKGAAKSKTMYLALALSVLTPALENFPNVESFLGDNYGWALVALSMLVAGLRFITTKGLDEK